MSVIGVDRDQLCTVLPQMLGKLKMSPPWQRSKVTVGRPYGLDLRNLRTKVDPVARRGAEDEMPAAVFLVKAPISKATRNRGAEPHVDPVEIEVLTGVVRSNSRDQCRLVYPKAHTQGRIQAVSARHGPQGPSIGKYQIINTDVSDGGEFAHPTSPSWVKSDSSGLVSIRGSLSATSTDGEAILEMRPSGPIRPPTKHTR